MDVEQINVTFRWVILLAMVILLGLLAAFIIFANVREENSHGLHEIVGGLLVLTATYVQSMFSRTSKEGAPVAPVSAPMAPVTPVVPNVPPVIKP